MEVDNKLPFLDVLVFHTPNGSLQFDWYTKPTSSGRLLNYLSNHPPSQKLNVMDNLIKRIFTTSPQFHTKNRKIISDILISNNYPSSLIEQRIKKYFSALNSRIRSGSNNNSTFNTINTSIQCNSTIRHSQNVAETQYRGMHFDPACSQNISKLICKGIPDLKMGFKPYLTNRSVFSKPKQKTPKERMYNVVYNIPCYGDGLEASCDLSYVGTTGHRMGIIMDQHEADLVAYNLNNDLEEATAIVHHFHDTGHVPDRGKATILEVEHTYTKRKVLESLHILTQPNAMNFRRDTENISAAYRSLLS